MTRKSGRVKRCGYAAGCEARLCLAVMLCAEHVRQLGGESPLLNLMEVKS